MVRVVDGLLEDIRMGMEVNIPELNQCRISCVKFLGELYNYQIVESNVIFRTLYSFLTFGRNADGEYVDTCTHTLTQNTHALSYVHQ